MRTNPAAEAGVFNPRAFVAFLLSSAALLLAMMSFAGTAGAGADQQGSTPAKQALAALQSASGAQPVTQVSRHTGNFAFVRAPQGSFLAAADRAATPQARALAFLATHGAVIGMGDAERNALSTGSNAASGSDLRIAKTDTDELGFSHVRFDQFYKGLKVFGARVMVHMKEGGITAVNGDFVSNISVSTIPALTKEAAGENAMMTSRKGAPDPAAVKIDKTELAVYPLGLIEGQGSVVHRLAYAVDVSGGGKAEQIWIDAQTGNVLARVPRDETALYRIIYSPEYDPQNPDLFIQRQEGDPPSPAPFVNHLYDFAGQTYDLYSSAFGRDSYDAKGHKMRSVYLINQQCPNAYWNGESTNYCPAFDADDVVSHEWSHAYTEYTHGLIYSFQSGALNESYSDIFGETVDLLNQQDGIGGSNNAEPYPNGQRWLVGEDLSQQVQELLLRDMYDPDRLGAPSKVSSPNYFCGTDDGGGVHTNSGVPNHAYALIVDGTKFKPADPANGQPKGTYNGQTITGIGLTKAAAIYFRAESVYQTPTTDFPAHDSAIQTSCSDLIGAPLNNLSTTNPNGTKSSAVITASDCQQVAKAMLAVEMSAVPPCGYGPLLNPNPAPLCKGPTTIFSEDWESGENGWTKTSQGFGTGTVDWEDATKDETRFFHVVSKLPGGRTGSAAFAADPKVGETGGGTCQPGGDYSGSHTLDSPDIVIPAGATEPLLVFDQYVATEAGVDGGQVEISRNGGAFTLLPRSEYIYNPPNSKFNEAAPVGNNTGPNPNEDAWTGTNLGSSVLGSWGTTIANLKSVAQPGDTIKIRFTWSQDGCNGIEGWYVDNIRVITCPNLKAPVLSTGSDYRKPDKDGSFTLHWTRPAGATGPDVVQESETSCGPVIADDAENGLAKWTTTTAGVGAQPWMTSSDKPQHTSTTFTVKGTKGVTNADSFLTYNNPIAIPGTGQTFLNFQDWDDNESDDNVTVEVSTNNGANWVPVYTHNRSESGTTAASFASEPLFDRSVNLANFGGKTIRLRFHYSLGPDVKAASTPIGWYVDNIAIVNDSWTDVAQTSGTSLLQNAGTGSYCYRVRTTYRFGNETAAGPFSNIVNIQVAPGVIPKVPATLQNISTRANVLKGDQVMIGGFIITGSAPKSVLLRGLGPSINNNNVPVNGKMQDPTLELHGPNGGAIASNDNWKQTQRAKIEATGIPPTDDRESAIVRTLNPGRYTVILRGKNNDTGIALVEAYDLDLGVDSKLANISTRAFVQPGDDVLIGGFIAGPNTRGGTDVLVRALGPSVPADPRLADPTLEIVNGNGATIATNDNWKEGGQQAAIAATGVPPSNDLEAAVLVSSLRPGKYTAIVRGKGNSVGTALVEVYNLR
jgi:Zn-dependent metalloprotease